MLRFGFGGLLLQGLDLSGYGFVERELRLQLRQRKVKDLQECRLTHGFRF